MARRRFPDPFISASAADDRELPAEFQPIVRLWVLRVLVLLNRLDSLLEDYLSHESEIFKFLGVRVVLDESRGARDRVKAEIRSLHAAAENDQSIVLPEAPDLMVNARWCQAELGMSDADVQILVFLVLERQASVLGTVMSTLGNLTSDRLFRAIAVTLGLPLSTIRQCFHPEGALAGSGLLQVDERGTYHFREKVDMLNGLVDRLTVKQPSLLTLFQGSFVSAGDPTLTPDRFEHLQPRIAHLEVFLRQSLVSGASGVNVLVYGPPGVGKTQCALVLAKSIGADCFEVAVKNGRERLSGAHRLNSFVVAQSILKRRRNAVVVFDEIEDIDVGDDDEDGLPFRIGRRTGRKGFFNQLLETNATPTIWISNRIRQIDSAHLRRFSYCLEMAVPPRSVRSRILAEHVAGLDVEEQWCHRVAANEHLSPGIVSNAARVVKTMVDGGVVEPVTTLLQEVINGSLEAQRRPTIPRTVCGVDLSFRMDAINCDVDPSALVEGLRQHPNARLLMNGPPGSGKSFFARQIAEALGMTVMVQRASDLITAFVGETEQNIAAAFRSAQSEGAMLIVDEADTFLNSRSASTKHYTVSMVNEMLTQLEDFQGLCAFTTNFKDKLDEAVMRRFDLKITFHYSDPEHVLVMLEETCRALGIPHGDLKGFAHTLPNVTPGDFATVVRQSRFNPLTTVEEVLKRLRQESSHKTVNRATTIGFMRAA